MAPETMKYIDLFRQIDEYFLRAEALARVRAFLHSERQVEGWFKGELLLFLQSLEKQKKIDQWKPEYRTQEIGNRRIDFYIRLDDGPLHIELKSFYHGNQAGSTIDLDTCFSALPSDIDKLADLQEGNKFSLVFVTPKPNSDKWKGALQKFQRKFPSVAEVTTRDEFPDELFIAKLQIEISEISKC